jgi:hypothetical protein
MSRSESIPQQNQCSMLRIKTEYSLTSDDKFCPVRDECVPLLEV